MSPEVLSCTFKASRVSHPVSLLLRLQIISCVILDVGAERSKCSGECRVNVVLGDGGMGQLENTSFRKCDAPNCAKKTFLFF